MVVVAYGEILRRHILELARDGAINVHPSLLPRYRGSSPVPAAIMSGDERTGISIIKLIRKLDAGPVLRQQEFSIRPGEDAGQLSGRLADVASEMLPQTCLDWMDGDITPQEQDESLATMTREWSRDDARVNWQLSAVQIERLVRASQPWPVAWTTLEGEPFRIHSARVANETLPTGRATRLGKRIIAGCGNAALELLSVQPAGKRAMPAPNWWNGVQADAVQFDAG